MKKNNLTRNIMIGMFLGFALGALLHQVADSAFVHDYITMGILDLIGRIFIIFHENVSGATCLCVHCLWRM